MVNFAQGSKISFIATLDDLSIRKWAPIVTNDACLLTVDSYDNYDRYNSFGGTNELRL
jgi:hypothetical protein